MEGGKCRSLFGRKGAVPRGCWRKLCRQLMIPQRNWKRKHFLVWLWVYWVGGCRFLICCMSGSKCLFTPHSPRQLCLIPEIWYLWHLRITVALYSLHMACVQGWRYSVSHMTCKQRDNCLNFTPWIVLYCFNCSHILQNKTSNLPKVISFLRTRSLLVCHKFSYVHNVASYPGSSPEYGYEAMQYSFFRALHVQELFSKAGPADESVKEKAEAFKQQGSSNSVSLATCLVTPSFNFIAILKQVTVKPLLHTC